MFGATPANVPYYLRFVERYASLGYAIAFSRTGNFFEAQSVVERAFAAGYPAWASRFSHTRDTEETLRRLLERHLPSGSEDARGAPAPSFARSHKLQKVQEAQDLLLGFPAEEMTAIFLEVVEEMPRDKAARLMGRPVEFFDEVHAELARRVQEWRPTEPQALEVFARSLRQYRLAPAFLTHIESKLDFSWRRTFNVSGIVRNALIAGVVVLVMIFAAEDRGPRRVQYGEPVSFNRNPPYLSYAVQQPAPAVEPFSALPGTAHFLLWVDLLLLATILALKRGLERYEGEGLALSGDFENPLGSLSLLNTFGVILVVAGCIHFVRPSVFYESWVPIAYVAAHALFFPMAAAGVTRVVLRVLMRREVRN